jgi:hypothetical protein
MEAVGALMHPSWVPQVSAPSPPVVDAGYVLRTLGQTPFVTTAEFVLGSLGCPVPVVQPAAVAQVHLANISRLGQHFQDRGMDEAWYLPGPERPASIPSCIALRPETVQRIPHDDTTTSSTAACASNAASDHNIIRPTFGGGLTKTHQHASPANLTRQTKSLSLPSTGAKSSKRPKFSGNLSATSKRPKGPEWASAEASKRPKTSDLLCCPGARNTCP